MNKNRYRLIFSKIHGFLIPVPEIVTTVRSPSACTEAANMLQVNHAAGGVSPLACVIALILATVSLPLRAAIITPDTRVPDKTPHITQGANGVPVIEIANPAGNGVSHNQFTEFNTDKPGVIFNNSMSRGTSHTGGLVTQNPNLKHSAQAIITEVTGSHASQIGGTLEVFGPKADLFITNPNGITLNGVITLNTDRLSATAGHVLPGAQLTFSVDDHSGRVVIGSDGVDTRGLSYFDVVARSITLNGSVGSASKETDIQMLAGPLVWDSNLRTWTKGTTATSGGVAIDGTLAGSMYGHNISLVSTASGAGVNQPGAVHAAQDIHISSDGDVTVSHLEAGQNIDITSHDNLTASTLDAGHDITLNAGKDLQLTTGGSTASTGNLNLSATGDMTLHHAVSAGQIVIEAPHLLLEAARLSATAGMVNGPVSGVRIHAGSLTLNGQLNARDKQTGDPLTAGETLVNDHGILKVRRQNGRMDVNFTLDSSTAILSQGNIQVDVNSLVNNGGLLQSQNGGLTVKTGSMQNSGSFESAGALALVADMFNNACRQANVGAQLLCGRLLSGGNMDIHTATLNNDGLLATNGTLSLQLTGDLNNTGTLQSLGELTLDSRHELQNRGNILTNGKLTMKVDGALTNDGGVMQGQDVLLTGRQLTNRHQGNISGKSVDVQVSGALNNDNSLLIGDALTLTLQGQLMNQNSGHITGETVKVRADALQNTQNALLQGGRSLMMVLTHGLVNSHALLKGSLLDIQAQDMTNTDGGEWQADELKVSATGMLRNDKKAVILSTGELTLSAGQELELDNSTLSGGVMTVAGRNVSLSHATVKGGSLGITAADTFTSQGSTVVSTTGNIAVTSRMSVLQAGGISAGGDLSLSTDTYTNTAHLAARKNGTLTLGHDLIVDATHHLIQADEKLTVKARNITFNSDFNNLGSIELQAEGNLHNNADVITGDSLLAEVKGDIINGAKHLVWAAKNLVLKAAAHLTNDDEALLMAQQDITLTAGTDIINNAGGKIQADRDVTLNAPKVINNSHSRGDAQVTAAGTSVQGQQHHVHSLRTDTYYMQVDPLKITNTLMVDSQGLIQAGRDMRVNTGASGGTPEFRNNGGQVIAGNDITIHGDLWNSGASKEVSLEDILKLAVRVHVKVSPSVKGSADHETDYSSYWALLDGLLSGHFNHSFVADIYDDYSDQEVMALQAVTDTTGLFQKVMSATLGADWKSQGEGELGRRWKAFKANPNHVTVQFYGKAAELSAGNNLSQSLGAVHNGEAGGTLPVDHQTSTTVNVGGQTLTTPLGTIDASFSYSSLFKDGRYSLPDVHQAMNPVSVLEGLIKDNPLFVLHTDDGNTFQSIIPLYETRIEYIDQKNFFGSEYFFKQIGYHPETTPAVLGDAYFDHQLIDSTITRVAGNFLALKYHLSGPALVKQMIDNAGKAADSLHLTPGEPLTEDQYNNLTEDIVWYEMQAVEGHLVLLPKVYLAKTTLQAIENNGHNSAQITAGNNIHSESTSVDNVNGLIKSGNNVAMHSSGKINNISIGGTNIGIEAGDGGQALVVSDKVVNNLGGNISGGVTKVFGAEGINDETEMQSDEQGNEVSRHNGRILSTHDVLPPTPKELKEQAEQEKKQHQQREATAYRYMTLAERTKVDQQKALDAEEAKAKVAPHIDPAVFFAENDIEDAPDKHELGSVFLGANKNVHITGTDIGRPDPVLEKGKEAPAGYYNSVTIQTGGSLTVEDVHNVHSEHFSTQTASGFLKSSSTDVTSASATSQGSHINGKRMPRTVLTKISYSAGRTARHGNSSPTRFTGQSAITSSTW